MSVNDGAIKGETLGLIVPTRNRLEYLRPRLSIWAKAGFDEVIVINTVDDRLKAKTIRASCEALGIRYFETERTFRDLRSRARNLGAQAARTTWVFFCDDDVGVITGLNHRAFEEAARGKDWLAGEYNQIIVLHRRSAFLAFGGYPEDMVASEDDIMSLRARRLGRGGREGDLWTGVVNLEETPREEPLNRARAHFWYSATLPLYLLRTPDFELAIKSDVRRVLGLARRALTLNLSSGVYLIMYAIGRLFSPVHLLAVLARLGVSGLSRERPASWEDVR